MGGGVKKPAPASLPCGSSVAPATSGPLPSRGSRRTPRSGAHLLLRASFLRWRLFRPLFTPPAFSSLLRSAASSPCASSCGGGAARPRPVTLV